jgi:hypothetical protein
MNDQTDRWLPLDYPGGLVNKQWLQQEWNGLPQLVCIHCQWDTLEGLEEAQRHAAHCPRCHPAPVVIEPSPILVADKRGNIQSGG